MPPRPTRLTLKCSDVVVAHRHVTLELGDRGVRRASRSRIASDSSKARRASCLSPISSVSSPRSKLAAARRASDSGVVSRSAWSRSPQPLEERLRLLQQLGSQRGQRRGCSSARASRGRRRRTASPRRSPSARGPRRVPFCSLAADLGLHRPRPARDSPTPPDPR